MANQLVIKRLRRGVWIYFYLLIFEGALRKWVLPGLAEPLLIIRDPVVIWILYMVTKNNLWTPNNYVKIVWIVTFLSFIFTFIIGHGNLVVALYGFRITFFHFPLIFIIPRLFNHTDVEYLGKHLLYINIAMTLLVGIQFFSPQSAWVNRGLGGVGSSGFSGAAGYFRVPGTFSFTNGLSLFYGFVAPYVLYFWISTGKKLSIEVPKWLLIGSTIALIASIPLSVSRTVMAEVFTSALFLLMISGRDPRVIGRLLLAVIVVVVLVAVLNNFSFFQTATKVFTSRFDSASMSEGGLEGTFVDRFLGGLVGAILDENASLFGLGLGMGTNAGAAMMTGRVRFLIAEGEWGRIVGEMGLLLGFLMILARGVLSLNLLRNSWSLIKTGNTLPWMMTSFAFLVIFQGQWAQPTALGFSVLSGGLVIASMRK